MQKIQKFDFAQGCAHFLLHFCSLAITYALVREKLKHLCIALQIITQIFYSYACSFRHNYL